MPYQGHTPATSISVSVLYTVSHMDHEDGVDFPVLQDCTNGGVTGKPGERYFGFILWSSRAEYERSLAAQPHGGAVTTTPERSLVVVRRVICGENYIHCEPAVKPNGLCGPMAGGNFVYTSDSRYREVTGVPYPISVHDRFETPELNEQLSR